MLATSHAQVFPSQTSFTQYPRISSNLPQHLHSCATLSSHSFLPIPLPKRIRQMSSQTKSPENAAAEGITQERKPAASVDCNIPSDCELFALVNADCIADSQRFTAFTTAFRNLALRKWENEASKGADPEGLRHEWGVEWVPLPDNLSIHEMPILRSRVVEASKKNRKQKLARSYDDVADCNVFYFVNEEVVDSVLDEGRTIPFIYAVNANYRRKDGQGESGGEEEAGAYYKVAVDTLTDFWYMMGTADSNLGMEELVPSVHAGGGVLKDAGSQGASLRLMLYDVDDDEDV